MNKAMRCQSCGQGWELHKTDEFNSLPATFCPICGTPTLERTSSVFGTDAKCFAAFGHELTKLLYQVWRQPVAHDDTTHGAAMPARFIDYVRSMVE